MSEYWMRLNDAEWPWLSFLHEDNIRPNCDEPSRPPHEPFSVYTGSKLKPLRQALTAPDAPRHLLVWVYHDRGNKLQKIGQLLRLPITISRFQRLLKRHKFPVVRSYFVYPDQQQPMVIAQWNTSAARYTHARLIAGEHHRLRHMFENALAFWCGCSPAAAGVVLVAQKA